MIITCVTCMRSEALRNYFTLIRKVLLHFIGEADLYRSVGGRVSVLSFSMELHWMQNIIYISVKGVQKLPDTCFGIKL